ncbi:IS66 family transposase zinc-finger binding domain-containing protein [Thorsellia anophelis]|nr:IS66 family transposase zinc-finger binding domain-containing protein [Thorsellia anophelis]
MNNTDASTPDSVDINTFNMSDENIYKNTTHTAESTANSTSAPTSNHRKSSDSPPPPLTQALAKCMDCGNEMMVIGTTSTEKLSIVPAKFVSIIYVRNKCSCRNCGIVKSPILPYMDSSRLPSKKYDFLMVSNASIYSAS